MKKGDLVLALYPNEYMSEDNGYRGNLDARQLAVVTLCTITGEILKVNHEEYDCWLDDWYLLKLERKAS